MKFLISTCCSELCALLSVLDSSHTMASLKLNTTP